MPLITSAGAIPTSVSDLNAALLATALQLSPGLTSNLPGSLIEDLSSTATGALVVQDQAAVDLINSIGPTQANEVILYQLGAQNGIPRGIGSNTSVFVVFSGTPGFVVNAGTIVGDGTHQYVTQEAAIISPPGPIGQSAQTFCIASESGSWAVPVGTVTEVVTSIPPAYQVTCTNTATGIPQTDPQTLPEYQAQVIQAQQAVATGTPPTVKTALQLVNGVQARLVAFRQTGGGWQVIVGGGDPYQVANAIFQSMFNILDLVGAATLGTTEVIAINDFPDTYEITFVVPNQQVVELIITWNTEATANFVSPAVVVSLVNPAMVNYINSIVVGQPISELSLQDVFITAVAGSIPESVISKLQFVVKIDGSIVAPPTGGVLIFGDPESYFFAVSTGIAINQG